MYTLNSEITIGPFKFGGVNDVVITRSIHSLTDKAVIKIPAIARLSGNPDKVVTGTQFADGDAVTIKLGYGDNLQTEFMGFVTHRSLDMPLTVTGEGYSSLLKRVNVNLWKQHITIADLLEAAVQGLKDKYDITVQCNVDITLNNVQLVGNGLDVLRAISRFTDGNVGCFFIQPGVLWCGMLYSGWAKGADLFRQGSMQYKAGYNVINTQALKPKVPGTSPTRVQYGKRLRGGGYISGLSNVFANGITGYQRRLNQLGEAITLQQLADEKALRLNYSGYEGHMTTFLEPFAAPGFSAYITDPGYPERDGNYLVEGVETHFGQNGARRKVAIGPKFGFLNERK